MKNCDLFINESDYPGFGKNSAVAHLQQAIRFATVSHLNTAETDYGVFDRFREYLKTAYPLIASRGEWEVIGHSLLIRIEGEDPSLQPVMLMAHQDVVPIQEGTEHLWKHPPFGGDLADGFIWGRGAIDIKEMLIGHMEAAEYLLSCSCRFKRTLYLAFGEDEETVSTGAMAICRHLKDRGIRLAFILDEGAGNVVDAADLGAPGTLTCSIATYEKGYGDLRLTVGGRGGHSSNPFRGTSLGILAGAIAKILENPPAPKLNDCVRSALRTLAPHITREPMKTWVEDMDAHEEELLRHFMQKESLYHQVSTTIAPTMITPGAPAANVMPREMSAVINYRFAPQDTPESVMAQTRALLDESVFLEWEQQIGASRPSRLDTGGFDCLKGVLEHYFKDLVFIPAQNRGATDLRQYEPLSDCCLRFGPFLEEEDVSAEGMHGTNERISVRAYLQGIRVLIRLVRVLCIDAEALL